MVARSKAAWIHTSMDLLEGDRFWYRESTMSSSKMDGAPRGYGSAVDGWKPLGSGRSAHGRPGIRRRSDEGHGQPELEANHRIGPFFAYAWFDRPGEGFNKPTVAVIVNWHLTHPYRAGQHSAQGLRLIAFAFGRPALRYSVILAFAIRLRLHSNFRLPREAERSMRSFVPEF